MAPVVRTMAREFNINASSGKLLYFFLQVKAMTQIDKLFVTCIHILLVVESYKVNQKIKYNQPSKVLSNRLEINNWRNMMYNT
jgi:hypothetical protein